MYRLFFDAACPKATALPNEPTLIANAGENDNTAAIRGDVPGAIFLNINQIAMIRQKIKGVCTTAWLRSENVNSFPKDSFFNPTAVHDD